MNIMNMPGFTAEFAMSTAGRGYRAITNFSHVGDNRASVDIAVTKMTGPGGMQCELDSTLTVVEDEGTSTTNFWKCTTTIDTDGGGSGIPTSSDGGDGGGSGGGSGSGGQPKPPKPDKSTRPTKKQRTPKNTIQQIGEQWLDDCLAGERTGRTILSVHRCCRDKADECKRGGEDPKVCTERGNWCFEGV